MIPCIRKSNRTFSKLRSSVSIWDSSKEKMTFQSSMLVWRPILKLTTWMNPKKSMNLRNIKRKRRRLTRSSRISFMKILMKNKKKLETYGKRMMKEQITKSSSNYRLCLKKNMTIRHNLQIVWSTKRKNGSLGPNGLKKFLKNLGQMITPRVGFLG